MPNVDRRTMLRGGAAAAAVLAAPAVLRPSAALSQSGQVNVLAWGDYMQEKLREAFEEETGIKMNVSTYGSNVEAENRLRSSADAGFDLVFPSLDTGPNYYSDGLLQPIDEGELKADRIIPSIYRASMDAGASDGGRRYLVPFNWGTEAVTWSSEAHPELEYGALSYGDLWRAGMKGETTIRPSSALIGLALHLDATGEVPSNRAMDMFRSREEARRVFEAVATHAIGRKENIGALWRNATEAAAAFTSAGCTIGQTWDTTGIRLHRDTDETWRYTMPKEGGLAWADTMAIPAAAENVDQAYALMNFLLQPEIGAMFANDTGYNSAAVGASDHLDDELKVAYDMAYPDGQAIDNLWWWPAPTGFFVDLRWKYARMLVDA